jgi:hypothetical protein
MSANEDSSSDDDDDFNFESSNIASKRYPVHDCCEYEDAESLRVSRDLPFSTIMRIQYFLHVEIIYPLLIFFVFNIEID